MRTSCDRSHDSIMARGVAEPPSAPPVDAALARRQERRDPTHDQVGRVRAWRAARSVPAGSSSVGRNGRPTRTVTRPPGCGKRLARRPDPVASRRSRSGTIGAPVRRASRATPSCASWSAPSGLRVPSGKTNSTCPSSRMRCASRKASTSAAAAVDRVDAAVGRDPADDRPVEQLALAEPVDPPAQPRDQPRADDDGVQVRGVVGGDDERAVVRDLVERALDRDAGDGLREQPAGDAHGPDQRRDRALDRGTRGRVLRRPVGGWAVAHRWPRGSAAGSAGSVEPGLGVADRARPPRPPCPRTGCRRSAMIRASSAGRSGATARVESSRRGAVAPRGWPRPPARPGRGRAPRARRRGALLDGRVEEELQVGVGQHDGSDVAAGHDDPARRRRCSAAAPGGPHAAPGRPRRPTRRRQRRGVRTSAGAIRRRRRGRATGAPRRRSPARPRPRAAAARRHRSPGRRVPATARSPRGTAARCRRTGSRPGGPPRHRRCSCPTSRARRGRRRGASAHAGPATAGNPSRTG